MMAMPSTPVNRPMRFPPMLARCTEYSRQAAPNTDNLQIGAVPTVRSGLENLPDERPFLRRRLRSDKIIFRYQGDRFRKPSVSIVANRGQGFAFFHAIADTFMKSQPDGVIDGIFLFFAT